jgi:hypothetical protein
MNELTIGVKDLIIMKNIKKPIKGVAECRTRQQRKFKYIGNINRRS